VISFFDLFKIGIGPSSSHTVGPMVATRHFMNDLAKTISSKQRLSKVSVTLFGSLASTGIGHGTDKAVQLGLMGLEPRTLDLMTIEPLLLQIRQTQQLNFAHFGLLEFSPEHNIVFESSLLDVGHPNALHCIAYDQDSMMILSDTYYSIGGGFIHKKGETSPQGRAVPCHHFKSAKELLALCQQQTLTIAQLMFENELAWHARETIETEIQVIWQEMQSVVQRGLTTPGILPGGLNLIRRAPLLYQRLIGAQDQPLDFLTTMDWVNAWALAVNEENAAGSRVVTAPTNGAAGIVPSVMMFASRAFKNFDATAVQTFLLTATAFGYLFKRNASISGAEVGCQGEVGSACAMAAAGLAAVMGGSPYQIENAAEIATEHNLGLTCDPVAGLVQVPCIERNAIAAVKAINAARMALLGDGQHFISFDKVVATVRDTGADMQSKYKETSQGGLAVNGVEC